MGHVVMLFDRRVRATADNTRAEVLSRVRTVAIGNGCNSAQKAIVVGCAENWLDLGIGADVVVQRAREKAVQLRLSERGPDGGAAA